MPDGAVGRDLPASQLVRRVLRRKAGEMQAHAPPAHCFGCGTLFMPLLKVRHKRAGVKKLAWLNYSCPHLAPAVHV